MPSFYWVMTTLIRLRLCKALRRNVLINFSCFLHFHLSLLVSLFQSLIAFAVDKFILIFGVLTEGRGRSVVDVTWQQRFQLVVLDMKLLHNTFDHRFLFFLNSSHELKIVLVNITVLAIGSMVTMLLSTLWLPFDF